MFPLKPKRILAAVKFFNDTIQYNGQVGRQCQNIDTLKTNDCPIIIKQKIEENRRLRRGWHQLRTPESKRLLNTATQELKQLSITNKKK
jgi:hypothetical protein